MGETQNLVQWVSGLGVPGILIAFGIALYKKIIVPGWVLEQERAERQREREEHAGDMTRLNAQHATELRWRDDLIAGLRADSDMRIGEMKAERDRWMRDGWDAMQKAGNIAALVWEKKELETNGDSDPRSDKAAKR